MQTDRITAENRLLQAEIDYLDAMDTTLSAIADLVTAKASVYGARAELMKADLEEKTRLDQGDAEEDAEDIEEAGNAIADDLLSQFFGRGKPNTEAASRHNHPAGKGIKSGEQKCYCNELRNPFADLSVIGLFPAAPEGTK